MPNPDTTQTSVQSISIAFPTGLVIFIITIALFQFRESIPSFRIVLWVGILIFSYLLTCVIFIVAQYIRCNQIDAIKALRGGIYTVITMLISLAVSSTAWFRVPVASVFAPLFVNDDVDVTLSSNTSVPSSSNNSKSSKCCTTPQNLETLEQKFPLLEGMSYGFYSFFGMMFGVVIGNGIATVC